MAGIESDAQKPALVKRAAARNRKHDPDPAVDTPAVSVRGAGYYAQGPVEPPMFTSEDHDKFRPLRITHVATRFRRARSATRPTTRSPPSRVPHRRGRRPRPCCANRIDKLIGQAGFLIPPPRSPSSTTGKAAASTRLRMKRVRQPTGAPEPTNLLVTLTHRRREDLPGLRDRNLRLPP